jgi:tetratricopeptide (TPR) repeat protein
LQPDSGSIYHDAGHPDEATRYGELAGKYEERSSTSPAESGEALPVELPVEVPTEPQVSAPAVPVATVAPTAAAAAAGETSGLFFHAPATSTSARLAPEPSEFEVQAAPPAAESEIDISDEWEGALSDEPAVAPAQHEDAVEAVRADEKRAKAKAKAIAESIEEIRFYLAHAMADQAGSALAKLENLKPGAAQLAAMRDEIEAAAAQHPSAEPAAVEEISIEEEVEAVPEKPQAKTAPAPKSKARVLDEFVSDLESSIGEGFLPETTTREAAPQPEPEPETVAPQAATALEQASALGEFVADLEASLGDSFLTEAPVPQAEPQPGPVSKESGAGAAARSVPSRLPAVPSPTGAAAAPAPAPSPAAASPTFTYQPTPIRPLAPAAQAAAPKFDSGAGVDLAGMFGELKQELEEDAASADEDPETHYNLGVAFREMGLLDEAIGELQKVCQAAEHGHSFPQIMQTYTWLAQCFLDKGVPEAAIRWYEQALKLPDLDADTRTALHYELAASYETAGNRPEALNHFMEVYGSNIDYRDVAERIKALKS